MNKKIVVFEIILLGRAQGYFFHFRTNTVRPVASNNTTVITTEIKIFKFNVGSSVPIRSTIVLALLTFLREVERQMS